MPSITNQAAPAAEAPILVERLVTLEGPLDLEKLLWLGGGLLALLALLTLRDALLAKRKWVVPALFILRAMACAGVLLALSAPTSMTRKTFEQGRGLGVYLDTSASMTLSDPADGQGHMVRWLHATASLLEFIGDSVIVGHNIRFDLGFLNAALEQQARPRLPHRSIDTLALARRLLRDEVPNCKLGTLAERLRLPHTPSHRALDDALATGDLLHHLIERAGSLGVTGLDDLLVLPKLAGSAGARKLPLTDGLPRKPGVYLFVDARGEVLYVGKAANLRSRVRSYFSTDERRKIGQLLRETVRIDHHVCRNGLEAAVLELRLIHAHLPRYNRQGTRSSKYPYVKLTLDERFPRLSVVRVVKDDGALYLGPISSTKRAKRIIEAIESAAPIRRCTARSNGSLSRPTCAPAQIGVATCPCSGAISDDDYARVIDDLVDTLTGDPRRLLAPLEERIEMLADSERYEEAADVRDRADALAGALRRTRRFDLLRRAGEVRVSIGDAWVELHHGLLTACGADGETTALWGEGLVVDAPAPSMSDNGHLPVPRREEADELLTIAAWLDHNAGKIRLEHVSGVLIEPLPRIPSYAPKTKSPAGRTTERTGFVDAPARRRGRIPLRRV